MLAVTAIGLVSSLGLDASTSCAAARAGMSRITSIDDWLVSDEEDADTAPVAVHRVPHVSAGFFGYARLLQLGTAALTDLVRTVRPSEGTTGAVLVAGGEPYRKAWLSRAERDAELAAGPERDQSTAAMQFAEQRILDKLLAALLKRVQLPVDRSQQRTLISTSVGFIPALQQADDWLKRAVCKRCLVGGVDSLLDPTTLEALSMLRMLKMPAHPVGLMPGEAACFLLVEDAATALRERARILALLEAPKKASGAAHPQLQDASGGREALPRAINDSFGELADAGSATGLVVANMNGDPYRANAWTGALIEALAPRGLGSTPVWLPALSFGETGAATGPASIALAAAGFQRGYATSKNALVCLIDDFGNRGAVYVRAAT